MTARNMDPFRVHSQWGVLDEASAKPESGFGPCLWNAEANRTCKTTLDNGATTLIEALEKSKDKYSTRRCAGWRNVVKVHMIEDETGVKREKIQLENQFQWMSYGEYYDRVVSLSRGFAAMGIKERSTVVIYAETQRDWMVCAFAAWYCNAQVVTIYATLGEEGAVHGINETEAEVVVADARLLKVLTKALPQCKSVKALVTMTEVDPGMAEKIRGSGVEMKTVDGLVESGKSAPPTSNRPKPDDVAVVMYTSGTTGSPKGVIISHGNVICCAAGVEHDLKGLVTCEDTYLAYLPLAHIMEMGAEISFMALGTALGFGSPHTLTQSGLKLKRPESEGDAPCLGPTFMVFAPAVLDKVYQAVQGKRAEASAIGKCLFGMGVASGERHFDKGRVGANKAYNAIVFKKVQKLVGGNLKAMITGSAPLSPEIQKFVQTVLNAPVRQGYGLTETCAGSFVAFWGDNSVSSVGPPTVSAVARLADWPEGNYLNADKDKPGVGMRRGEVLIGGPSVTRGYYINPARPNPELEKKNEEDWLEIDGIRYFRTGDIGQIRPNGTLQIIDRKKDLWKGPNGEYVALTKVEAALSLCEFVELPMVYGKTGATQPIALLCPQKKRLEALGNELGLQGKDFKDLCVDTRIIAKVTEVCKAKCKEMKLADFETPKHYALISELWTPENEMLTAAMKMKRPQIAEKHSMEINRLYTAAKE